MPPECHTMEIPILGKTHCGAGRWTMTERMEIKDLNRVEMGKRIRERRELLKMSRDQTVQSPASDPPGYSDHFLLRIR